MIQKGIDSGKSEAKLAAVQAANRASLTRTGEGLGLRAVRAAINQDEFFPKGVDEGTVLDSGESKFWTSPDFVERHKAVAEAIGQTSTEIIEPDSPEEYLAAAHEVIDSIGWPQSAEDIANYAQARDSSMIQEDFRVPGAYYENRAVESLATETSPRG